MFGYFKKKAETKEIPEGGIVIVTQDDIGRELESRLQRKGNKTVFFNRQNDAVESMKIGSPRAIVLQAELEKGSGYSVCNIFRKNKHIKNIPLLFFASEGKKKTLLQHKQLPTRADEYVVGKNPEQIIESLEKAILEKEK